MNEHSASEKQQKREDLPALSQLAHTTVTENSVQAMFLAPIRRVRYNLLDGEAVVSDLLRHQDLWRAVYPARFSVPYQNRHDNAGKHVHPISDLAMMRNVSWGEWPADMLSIWTDQDHLPELRKLAEQWQGEIGVFNPEEPMDEEDLSLAGLFDDTNRVLWVWWDSWKKETLHLVQSSCLEPLHIRYQHSCDRIPVKK
ncbi:MAG TPA: hypothetical protein VFV38_40080 [Ktedonobacteraceae bacterium]|nr:hypothetical protein [Ktedonobacteraceae bacterium]